MSVRTDIDIMRGVARLVWRGLTDAQRSALRRARTLDDTALLPKAPVGTHARTRESLRELGLMTLCDWLTPLGAVVRDVGVQADAALAKRRYSRRAKR